MESDTCGFIQPCLWLLGTAGSFLSSSRPDFPHLGFGAIKENSLSVLLTVVGPWPGAWEKSKTACPAGLGITHSAFLFQLPGWEHEPTPTPDLVPCFGPSLLEWSQVKVAQSCPTLCDPMDYIVHGILQARILEWVSVPFSRGIFPTQGSKPGLPPCRRILYQLSCKGNNRDPGVGSLSLLQQIFPTPESNQGLLHCRRIHYWMSYQGSRSTSEWFISVMLLFTEAPSVV